MGWEHELSVWGAAHLRDAEVVFPLSDRAFPCSLHKPIVGSGLLKERLRLDADVQQDSGAIQCEHVREEQERRDKGLGCEAEQVVRLREVVVQNDLREDHGQLIFIFALV